MFIISMYTAFKRQIQAYRNNNSNREPSEPTSVRHFILIIARIVEVSGILGLRYHSLKGLLLLGTGLALATPNLKASISSS